MADKTNRNEYVYDVAVQMALAAIQSGSIRTADDACSFLDSVFGKLLELKEKALERGEYNVYADL